MVSITRAAGRLTLRSFAASRPSGALPTTLCRLPLINPTLETTRQFSSLDAYYDPKKDAKELRAQRFAERIAHAEKVKRRRDGKPRNTRKKEFNAWFRPKAKFEIQHNHLARKLGMDWKLQVAVVLERLPVVLPDKPQWYADYENLRTYLDQFGRDYPVELFGAAEIEELEDLTDEAILEKHLPRGFTPAPRETEADKTGDVRTLDRKLKTWVYMTVKETVETAEGEKSQWRLPTADLIGEETLLDTAKRAIREKVGDSLDIYYPSNCPMTMEMDVFKEEERAKNGNKYGTKKFFMVVQYDEGEVRSSDLLVDDFAWFDKGELVERIKEQEGEGKSKLYHYLLSS